MANKNENIIIISDSNSGSDNSSHSNNSSDSFGSTSSLISWYGEISTSEEYVHSSPDIVYSKGPSNSLLNWYEDLYDEYKDHLTNAKPTFSDISKAKVQPSRSKAKTSRSKAIASPKTLIVKSFVPIINCVLGLANAKTWDAILNKTFGLKIPTAMIGAEEKKGKRKMGEMIVLSSDSSDDNKGPSIASVPKEGSSIQGLLDWYGYETVEKYLEETFFPSTANVHTWDDILKKFRVRKPESCVDKAKGKRKFAAFAASICKKHLLCCKLLHLQHLMLHLQQAFAISICFAASYCICSKHLQQAFAISICFAASHCICSICKHPSDTKVLIMKMEILQEPTSNKLLVGDILRTASAAVKPCQGDSSEFYLITGSIYTDQRGTVVLAILFNESEQRHFRLVIANVYLESPTVAADGQRDVNHNPMLTLPTRYQRHHDN
ncbi:hypothetical protein Tco_0196785 [Tanacetum coccineum]